MNETTALYPPNDAPSHREHQFTSGGNRTSRLHFNKQKLQSFYQMFGGKEHTLQQFTQPWSTGIPSVEQGNHELAFEKFVESLEHGDPHQLIQSWSDKLTLKYQTPVNFCLPFLRFNFWQGAQEASPHLWVVVNNPDDHQRISVKHTKKASNLGATNFGNNFLAHVDNNEWRRRRFGMIFAVSPNANKTYFAKMERHTRALIQHIQNNVGGQFTYGQSSPLCAFNLHSMVEHTAFSIAADCLLGLDDAMINDWSQQIRWALQQTNATTRKQARKILKGWTAALMSRPIPEGMKGPLLQGLHEVGEDYPDATKKEKEHKEHPQSAQLGDVSILTLAMHDTTASTMAWCLTELARRPALQADLAAEAATVLSTKQKQGQSMTYDDLYKMPLLTKVINETMRLYPAVSYGTQRELETDEYITVPANDGVSSGDPQKPPRMKKILLPKGTSVMLHNFSNHRNKILWGNDANEFKPERWEGYGDVNSVNFDDSDGADGWKTVYSARNPQSARFHPFTRAPRQCFGMNFAQLEMRVVLPLLVSAFEFSLAEPTKTKIARNGVESETYELAGILKPRDGLWFHCKPRNVAKL
jgi:cytochrome P450